MQVAHWHVYLQDFASFKLSTVRLRLENSNLQSSSYVIKQPFRSTRRSFFSSISDAHAAASQKTLKKLLFGKCQKPKSAQSHIYGPPNGDACQWMIARERFTSPFYINLYTNQNPTFIKLIACTERQEDHLIFIIAHETATRSAAAL